MPRWLEPVVPHLQLEGSAAAAAGAEAAASAVGEPAAAGQRDGRRDG